MSEIQIAGRKIGPGHPCFIIAEAGVNHNGDVELARKLIDAAREAGADAVKFQTWITEEIVAPTAALAAYQRENLSEEQTQFAMLKALELAHEDFAGLQEYAQRRGILFLSTPDEEKSADFLHQLGLPLIKIGSAEVDNLSYLAHIGRLGRPVILSTGMAWLSEVEQAVRTLREAGSPEIILLHCVSNYPADPAACNLRAMETMRTALRCPVGFSDHTLGIHIALAAVAAGACVIEKHLTLDKNMEGPDHRASLDPTEFADLVRQIREVESSLGDGVKQPVASELPTRAVVRKVAVSSRRLAAGTVLRPEDLVLRRAAGGVPAPEISFLYGRRLKTAVEEFMPVEWAIVE